jgi:hypothetical protein
MRFDVCYSYAKGLRLLTLIARERIRNHIGIMWSKMQLVDRTFNHYSLCDRTIDRACNKRFAIRFYRRQEFSKGRSEEDRHLPKSAAVVLNHET